MAATTKSRESHWRNWTSYVQPLGVDPYLQGTTYTDGVRSLTGFAARVRVGGFGTGREVKADTVATAISAIGKEISLAHGHNPTKLKHSEKLLPRISQMLDGWRKTDGPVMKKLPVEADVPEYLIKLGLRPEATEMDKAVGDLGQVGYSFLLRSCEYCYVSGRRDMQTQNFRMKDIIFFKKGRNGKLRQLPRNAPDSEILSADMATLKLENQKNGWRGVCISQHWNGDDFFDGVRGLGRRYVHIRSHMKDRWSTPISAVWQDGKRMDVMAKHIRAGLKQAAEALDYPESRGIPIERIDTHSLRIGGANALHLAGYSDRQIQKMGRWRGETFKEYVREQLDVFTEGMSRSMRKCFGFVNVEGGAYHDITRTVVAMDYNVAVSDGSAAAA